MTRPARSVEDDLIVMALAAFALLVAFGAFVWLAAQGWMLVAEQRLLTPASGSIIDTGPNLVRDPGEPARAFAAADQAHLPGGATLYVLALALLAGTVAAVARMLTFLPSLGKQRDGRWARGSDLRTLRATGAEANRLVLGRRGRRLVATEDNHSVVVFGPTGSGKTSALVVPALLEHAGPAVALSVKTDLLRDTIGSRAGRGPVFVYDPLRLTKHEPVAWTPLRACKDWAEAQRMAEALTSAVGDTGITDTRFWDTMAAKMLEALMHAAALDGLTMRDVVRWVDNREQREVETILKRHDADLALESWNASINRDDRTLSSVYASAEVMLRAYAIPGMTDCEIDGSFDPVELLANNGTLYVSAPTEDQARLRPIFAALVKDVYRAAVLHAEEHGPLQPSLLLVLDEAANIAPIHDLAEIAATCRAYGIQLVTVFQDLAQVQARYRAKARTVVNNHTAKLLLPGTSDRELLDMLSRLLGEHAVAETSVSHSEQGTSRSHSTRYRPLASMHELRQLSLNRALLLYGNLPPVKLELRPWYRDPALRRLARKDAA